MNQFEQLTDANFMMYAMKAYNNPHCLNIDEFHNDLKRTKYIKRLLNRYKSTGILKERLILNHLMILYNMFGPEATVKILFFKLDQKFYSHLKTFLVYLNLMPEKITGIKFQIIRSSDIPLDLYITQKLRNL